MKIRPTGPGATRIPSAGKAAGAKVAGLRAKRAQAAAPSAPERSLAAAAAEKVAGRLRSGEIAPKQAISLLVEATLDRLPAAALLRKRMRAALVHVAGEDPGLLSALERSRRR